MQSLLPCIAGSPAPVPTHPYLPCGCVRVWTGLIACLVKRNEWRLESSWRLEISWCVTQLVCYQMVCTPFLPMEAEEEKNSEGKDDL